MKLEDVHDCSKCRSKIVCIARDALGATYCAYCGERVDYRRFFEEMNKDFQKEYPEFLEKVKRELVR